MRNKLSNELDEMKGLKFIKTLAVTFEKMTSDGEIYKTAYVNGVPKTVTFIFCSPTSPNNCGVVFL